MYNLAEARLDTQTHSNEENWEGKISCFYGDETNAMKLNNLRDTVEVYGFTFVRAGEVVYTGNDRDFPLHRNDLYINLPGFIRRLPGPHTPHRCEDLHRLTRKQGHGTHSLLPTLGTQGTQDAFERRRWPAHRKDPAHDPRVHHE